MWAEFELKYLKINENLWIGRDSRHEPGRLLTTVSVSESNSMTLTTFGKKPGLLFLLM